MNGVESTSVAGIKQNLPQAMISLEQRYRSLVVIKTPRAEVRLRFIDGKLDDIEQKETIPVPK